MYDQCKLIIGLKYRRFFFIIDIHLKSSLNWKMTNVFYGFETVSKATEHFGLTDRKSYNKKWIILYDRSFILVIYISQR